MFIMLSSVFLKVFIVKLGLCIPQLHYNYSFNAKTRIVECILADIVFFMYIDLVSSSDTFVFYGLYTHPSFTRFAVNLERS